MKSLEHMKQLEIWFVTGSQHLYGADALAKVADHAKEIAGSLDREDAIPFRVVARPVMTTAEEIRALFREANASETASVWCCGCNLFAGQDVDRGPQRVHQAVPASAHPVQSRPALGDHRHGLHEPEPGRAWRP